MGNQEMPPPQYINVNFQAVVGKWMKVILHIGTSKAGSTSIQSSLLESHEALLQERILFPVDPKTGGSLNYKLLSNALCGIDVSARASRILKKIDVQVEKYKPELLVLSTEFVWGRYDYSGSLVRMLMRWGSEITFLGVVREHSSYFLSKMQQHLKGTGRLPSPLSYQTKFLYGVEQWNSVGGAVLDLVALDRGQLRNQSLVHELASRYFPGMLKSIGGLTSVEENQTDPSEVTWLLQDYQLRRYYLEPRMRREDVVHLRENLLSICRSSNVGTRPKLLDNVRQTVLHNHADELRVLRDRWGITFSHFDYDSLSDMVADQSLKFVTRYHEICKVEGEDLKRIFEVACEKGVYSGADLLYTRKEIALNF